MLRSSSPSRANLNVRNGNRVGSMLVSAAVLMAAASFAFSNSRSRDAVAGFTRMNSAPCFTLLRYQNREPSFIHCAWTSSPVTMRVVFQFSSCSARS